MPRKKKEITLSNTIPDERPPKTIDEAKARLHIVFPDVYSYNRAIAIFNVFLKRATIAEAYFWVAGRKDSITRGN